MGMGDDDIVECIGQAIQGGKFLFKQTQLNAHLYRLASSARLFCLPEDFAEAGVKAFCWPGADRRR